MTKIDHSGWTMRETAHVNGGKEWFGYKHQCIQEPRLSRFDRYTRKDRSVQSTWRVDGQDCKSFNDALAELEIPPSISVDELIAICAIYSPPSNPSAPNGIGCGRRWSRLRRRAVQSTSMTRQRPLIWQRFEQASIGSR